MTDLQWLSSNIDDRAIIYASKVNMLWVICLESLQELLGTSWDMEERSLAKSLADEECRMLMARVWRLNRSMRWRAKKLLKLLLVWRLQTARTSYLPFNRLSSKLQQSQKISQNAARHSMSISWKSIELVKSQQSQKSSQNATRGGSCVYFLERSV